MWPRNLDGYTAEMQLTWKTRMKEELVGYAGLSRVVDFVDSIAAGRWPPVGF